MNVGYFIAGSLHYLPTILPLVRTTSGKILTFKKDTSQYIGPDIENLKVLYYKNYQCLRENFKDLSIDILVHPSFSVQFFKKISGVKHVQIFHGTSDKPFNYHKSLKFYDLIAVPGPRMKDEILERGLSGPDRISVIGYPKIDSFIHSNFDSMAYRQKIGIDTSKKTVLYSPTWVDPNKYSSFPEYVIKILRSLMDYNVIVKPHVGILRLRPWEILKAYMFKRKNCFIFPRSMDILPFMAVSDLMITDISSVSHEYLPFDKPLVFTSPKPKDKIPEEHTWIWQCGDVIENSIELYDVVKKNLDSPDRFKKERDAALKQIFYNFDGKSPERFKAALTDLMDK
jgi:CDP-glycerol glycerophosphotransferase (TagB/SpsB family)